MNEKFRQFILLVGDVILLYVSLFLALSLRYGAIIDGHIWVNHWPIFSYVFLIWIIVFYIAGFYAVGTVKNNLTFLLAGSQAMAVNILLAIAFFYVLPQALLTPKTILLLTGIIYFLLFALWRLVVFNFFFVRKLASNVLLIGTNPAAKELTRLLDEEPQLGFRVAALLAHNNHEEVGNLPDYRDPAQLRQIIQKHRIEIVVMDNASRHSDALVNNLYQMLGRRLEFLSLSDFYENITKRVSLEMLDKFWFLENLQEGKKRLFDLSKRIFDAAGALIGIAFSLLVAPIVALVIIIANGRPVFFTQLRLGKNGEPFRAVKFRTMVRDAEKDGPQWARPHDSRVTAFGRFLRSTRLDEIPQLLNILKGDMSFVGPRPERPEFVIALEKTIPFYRERLLVKPGLTGWAQINFPYGASAEDAMRKLQYDLYYIKNRSLILDLGIILKTIKTVLSAAGR